MFAREGERRLVEHLNETVVMMIKNGDLERIYRKYGIWDDAQRELATIAEAGRFYGYSKVVAAKVEKGELLTEEKVESGSRKRGLTIVREYGGIMVQAAALTVLLAAVSFPIAIIVGL